MQSHKTIFSLIIFTGLAVLSAVANAQSFTSTNKRISLVELYTSEGCSSCPPADRWINSLRNNDKLWSEFIPLAFHVDYWDYIGWQDPFANKAFSQRQYLYASQKNIRSVYTPGIILNGKEWRAWSRSRSPKPDTEPTGKLSINIEHGKISANYAPINKDIQAITLNIALIGFDQSSEITAGENNGKQFNHDFVVLSHQVISMTAIDAGFTVNTHLTDENIHQTNDIALVSWVNESSNLTPLQAVGGLLEKIPSSEL